MSRLISGTREWASYTANIQDGCANGCRYCYARQMAARFGRRDAADWTREEIRPRAKWATRRRYVGSVMFPSTHDITGHNIDACEEALAELCEAGNEVLIVTKPRPACVERLAGSLRRWRSRILWRLTITCCNDTLRQVWEPTAPSVSDRMESLRLLRLAGCRTSVSAEPLLQPDRAADLVGMVAPYVSESIWIGRANRLAERTRWCWPRGHVALAELERQQSAERMLAIYEELKDHSLVRWKESYKRVCGLPQPEAAGMDI